MVPYLNDIGSSAGTKVSDGALNTINFKQALEGEGFEVNAALWDALKAQPTTRASAGDGGGWGGPAPTGSAANTEENKAFHEGQSGTWAGAYSDAAIVVLTREGAEGTDLTMQDVDDDGVTPMSSLALHQNEKDLLALVREDFAKDTDDGNLLELLTEAAISWEYAISRSGITNGVDANAVIQHVTPWWQTAITSVIAVSGILTAACFVLLVVSKTKKSEH